MHSKRVLSKMALSMLLVGVMGVGAYADSYKIIDIKGKDRYETSIEAAKLVNSDIAILASGQNYADSLSAYNIASSKHAKLILVNEGTNLEKELKDQKIKKVYIVGGESVISSNLENKVKSIVKDTVRLAGKNRYETNKITLKESGFKSVGVADGRNFPDALSSAGLLMNKHLGLMLVDGSKPYSTDYKVEYTFGGKNSVKQDAGKRIFGKDRYETSLNIAKEMGKTDSVVLTTGKNFPDALGAVNLLNININKNTPIIIVSDSLSKDAKEIISKAQEKYLLGGALGKNIKVEVETTVKVTVDNNSSSGKSGSSRRSSSSSRSNVKLSPEQQEIIDGYTKNYEGDYDDDRWSPNSIRKLIETQKIKSVKPITKDMSVEEAVNQYIYNNFYVANSALEDLKKSDLPRFDKAIKEYKELPSEVQEELRGTFAPILEKDNNQVVYLGTYYTNDYFIDGVIAKDYMLGANSSGNYLSKTPLAIIPESLRDTAGKDGLGFLMYDISFKAAVVEKMNGIAPNAEEMAKRYKDYYSDLLNKRVEDIKIGDHEDETEEHLMNALYDYKYMPQEAKDLVKNEYEKISELVDDAVNSYNTPYSEENKKRYIEENYFKTNIYTMKNTGLKKGNYVRKDDGILNSGKSILNAPDEKDSATASKIYATDGLVYRFERLEYNTTDGTVKLIGKITNENESAVNLNQKTPFVEMGLFRDSFDSLYVILKPDSNVLKIEPKETVDMVYTAQAPAEYLKEGIGRMINSEKRDYIFDSSTFAMYDSYGNCFVGGAMISGKVDEYGEKYEVDGILVDGKELSSLVGKKDDAAN